MKSSSNDDAVVSLEAIPYLIESERLVLRAYDPQDEARIRELFAAIGENREHLGPHVPWTEKQQSVDDTRAWIRVQRGRFENMRDFGYGIYARDDGRLVGDAGLKPSDEDEPLSLEIGYWLRARETGKGFAREAARVLARVALEHAHAQRVMIRVEVGNQRSRRVPESLGFMFEGVARASIRVLDVPRDLAIYSLLPSEIAKLDG